MSAIKAVALSLAGGFLLAVTAGPTVAAPAAVDRGPARVADTVADAAQGQAAESEEEPGCTRVRKRLWVEGEGWVVRKVTLCR